MLCVDPGVLKARLRGRLHNPSLFFGRKLTLRQVIERAAELACQVVDDLAVDPAELSHPAAGKHQSDHAPTGREAVTAHRRRQIRAILARGPLTLPEIAARVQVAPHDCQYLLRTTPGVIRVKRGQYGLSGH